MWNRAINVYVDHQCHYDYSFAKWWYAPTMFHHIEKYMLYGDPSLRLGGSPIQYYFEPTTYSDDVSDIDSPDYSGGSDIQISGRSLKDGTLVLLAGNKMLSYGTPNEEGDFTITTDQALPEGVNVLTLKYLDEKGREGEKHTIRIVVDNTPPVISHLQYPELTSLEKLIIKGATELRARVSLYEGKVLMAETQAEESPDYSQTGYFELHPQGTLLPGVHQFTLKAVDLAGNLYTYPHPIAITIQ